MEIIPVIDLLNGCVVHAQRGQRSQYLPIQSLLCNSSEPLATVEALLKLYPFNRLYIADLDAIQQQGSNATAINEIQRLHPALDIWLDGGFRHIDEAQEWTEAGLTCVLGSENLMSCTHFLEMKRSDQTRIVLSLDYGIQGFMGPTELLDMPDHWPQKVIVMTLARVGSSQGPHLQMLETTLRASCIRSPAPRVYAAGGVRDMADLKALKEIGVAGVLVATALHNGSLSPDDLAAFHKDCRYLA